MVVAQLVERSLPMPEVRGSNPVIGKNLLISNICILSTVYWKDENKEKAVGNGPFFLKKSLVPLILFFHYPLFNSTFLTLHSSELFCLVNPLKKNSPNFFVKKCEQHFIPAIDVSQQMFNVPLIYVWTPQSCSSCCCSCCCCRCYCCHRLTSSRWPLLLRRFEATEERRKDAGKQRR